MDLMGRHSTPLDGVTLANGHKPELVPFTLPALDVRPRGPVSVWPQASRWRHARTVMSAHRAWLAAVPIVLVNSVAFAGQLAFLRGHLPWPLPGQVLVAVTLESVAVYLAWQAHLALAADDSAMRLRLAAYSFAAVIGVMNYSHWMAPHWRPTFTAITFGLMSVSSPWLWSVHSRRASRDALKARGLIEPHAVRLGATRWQWHPVRSVRVMSRATWAGETDPAAAIAAWEPRAARRAADAPADATETPVPDAGAAESPDAPEPRQESVSSEQGAAPVRASSRVKPKPHAAAASSSAAARALAVLKANPGLEDAEVVKRAKVSRATVTRARRELNGAKS